MITLIAAMLLAQESELEKLSDPKKRDEIAKKWAEKDLSADAKVQRVRVYFHSAN